ncbi:hypothetical protein ABH926_009046 [Catenulispora sp. GP43]|uniref:anti-sigma factor family protein n=1 Tax=Catenulispora sp. GP43 TaxID=3156263 RepID=UPI00351331FF
MNAINGESGKRRQECREQDGLRIWLGAYVLGALDEADSQRVRIHLQDCVECQQEYDELLEVRTMLDMAGAEAALAAGPEPVAAPGPAARGVGRGRSPRRRRRLGLAAAGALLASVAGIGGFLLGDNHSGTPSATRAVATTGLYGISASIRYHPEAWGTSMQVTMSNVPADYTCTLTAVGKDGRVEVASTWSSGPHGGTVTVPGAVAIPASSIDHFDVAVAPGINLTIPVPAG